MIPQDERERDRDRDLKLGQDHDLLVRLDTKMDALSTQFTEARVALALKADLSRVEALECSTAANRELIEELRRKLYGVGCVLGVLQVGLHWFLK
jgi:hypothetical protein